MEDVALITGHYGEALTAKMSTGIAICIAAVVFMILKPGKTR